jgi:hypothetical protein
MAVVDGQAGSAAIITQHQQKHLIAQQQVYYGWQSVL